MLTITSYYECYVYLLYILFFVLLSTHARVVETGTRMAHMSRIQAVCQAGLNVWLT